MPAEAMPTLLIGQSPAIREFVVESARISRGYAMLISGPPGSGKTLLARYAHEAGPRSRESVAFWKSPRKEEATPIPGSGRALGKVFRDLGRGTLVIEDVDRLPKVDQWLLLRYLDSGQMADVLPPTEGLDVRVIATTRRAMLRGRRPPTILPGLMHAFPYVVQIPPLSERPEDTELIARAYAIAAGREFTPRALAILKRGTWRGNVRQLLEVMEFAFTRVKGRRVDLADLAKLLGADVRVKRRRK